MANKGLVLAVVNTSSQYQMEKDNKEIQIAQSKQSAQKPFAVISRGKENTAQSVLQK